jgi:hypothetical protein
VSEPTGPGLAAAASSAARAVALRPRLWRASIGAVRRLARPGWWRRPPFLPVPEGAYWRFRMETAYGKEWAGRPTPRDVVDYLEWCQRARPPRR